MVFKAEVAGKLLLIGVSAFISPGKPVLHFTLLAAAASPMREQHCIFT